MGKVYGGRWEIIDSLDEGGQAHVFLVKDLSGVVSEPCVLKRIREPQRRPRFLAEVTACKKLDHPNIIRVIDHSALESDPSNPDRMFLVMPQMVAGNLHKRAALYKDSLDSTLQVALVLADTLRYAHSLAVIHRDVKPANILFAKDDHSPVLADFGICLLSGEPRNTEPREVVGPREFIAPELAGGGQLEVTPAADIYSLGKVIYFMISGGVILPRERQHEPQYDIFAGKGPRHLLLSRLLDRMICEVPSQRIQNTIDVLNEIKRIQEWEQKQGATLTSRASGLLSSLLGDQRTALSIEEHNKRIEEEERRHFSSYLAVVGDWLSQRIQELCAVLTHEGISTARVLTAKEYEESAEKTSSLLLDPGTSRQAGLKLSRGLLFSIQSPAAGHTSHRLLLNLYTEYSIRFVVGRRGKREFTDQPVLLVPYYFAASHWQAFFVNKPAVTELERKNAGRPTSFPRDFTQTFQALWTLFHRSRISEWPRDADAYKITVDAALETFLERIRDWSKSSFASLS